VLEASGPLLTGGPRAFVFLHPGQIVASTEPCTISTIVGSCVAVCLFDPVRRAGGSNHYMLPDAGEPGVASARFGDVATEELLRRMLAIGCRRRDLQAKIFGGASLLPVSRRVSGESLGMKNVHMARRILVEQRIAIVAEDVGGTWGRRVVFRTDVGEAQINRL
jgi:chemotaxis protein CheD